MALPSRRSPDAPDRMHGQPHDLQTTSRREFNTADQKPRADGRADRATSARNCGNSSQPSFGTLRLIDVEYNRMLYTRLEQLNKVAKSSNTGWQTLAANAHTDSRTLSPKVTNNKIMSINRRVGGHSKCEDFKKPIFFYCGDLELYSH